MYLGVDPLSLGGYISKPDEISPERGGNVKFYLQGLSFPAAAGALLGLQPGIPFKDSPFGTVTVLQ